MKALEIEFATSSLEKSDLNADEISKKIKEISSIAQERLSINGNGGFAIFKHKVSLINFLANLFS